MCLLFAYFILLRRYCCLLSTLLFFLLQRIAFLPCDFYNFFCSNIFFTLLSLPKQYAYVLDSWIYTPSYQIHTNILFSYLHSDNMLSLSRTLVSNHEHTIFIMLFAHNKKKTKLFNLLFLIAFLFIFRSKVI